MHTKGRACLQEVGHMAGLRDLVEDMDALPQQAWHVVLVTRLEQLNHLRASVEPL